MPTFDGTVTATEKLDATRLDKAFRLQPEFPKAVRVRSSKFKEDDPVFTTLLAYLEEDMKANPKRFAALSRRTMARSARLTRRVKVSLRRMLGR